MNEIKQVYYDDIREKKSIKNSANKKNRTGKGPVRFPMDYMSKKERESMNGEVKEWDLKHFYTYSEFKDMPDDIMTAYLNRIMGLYDVGLSVISEKVFGVSRTTLRMYLCKFRGEGVYKYLNVPKVGHKSNPNDVQRLIRDVENNPYEKLAVVEPEPDICEEIVDEPVTAEPVEEVAEEPVTAKPVEEVVEQPQNVFSRMSFELTGSDTVEMNLQMYRLLKYFEGRTIKISMTVEAIHD